MSDHPTVAPPAASDEQRRRKRRLVPLCRTGGDNAFSRILERLVHQVPGCHAVGFVDQEGEAVDVAGYGLEFDIKVASAYCNVILSDTLPMGGVRDAIVCAGKRSYFIRSLPEGYVLVMILSRDAAMHVSERALGECALSLAAEAGFALPLKPVRWHAVEVFPRGNRSVRPLRVRARGDWHPLVVLGRVRDLASNEQGYRVRVASGAEVTLVREPLGRWWADDRVE